MMAFFYLLFALAAVSEVEAHGAQRSLRSHGADEASEAVAHTMRTLDSNGDQRLDQVEIAHFAKQQGIDPDKAFKDFAAFDADGDGALNTAELAAALSPAKAGRKRRAAPKRRKQ
ncbi:unnamed protein product, partial [Polarella glacialis]